MTVPTNDNREQYLGNGATTVFPYAFKIFEDANLEVYLTEADGAQTLLTLGTDYTVTGAGNEDGGNVTYPVSGDPLDDDETLTILRVIDITQETDLRNQGAYYPEVVEDELDRSRMIDQQQQEEIDRALKQPVDGDNYDAGGKKIVGVSTASSPNPQDVVNADWVTTYVTDLLSGGGGAIPETFFFTGDGVTDTFLMPGIDISSDAAYTVTVDGLDLRPLTDYSVDLENQRIVFTEPPTAPADAEADPNIMVRVLGYKRAVSEGDNTLVTAEDGTSTTLTLAQWMALLNDPSSFSVTATGTSDTRKLDDWMVPINDPSIMAPVATGTNAARSLAARFADFVNVADYGAIGDGTFHPLSERFSSLINAQVVYPFVTSLDQGIDWAAWQAALNNARGKSVYSKNAHYLIDRTLTTKKACSLVGEGRIDYWGSDYTVGVLMETYGAGNPQRWTDIDGSDPADDTPLIVAGGNGCYLVNMTLMGDWSMGVLFPCVKQCGVNRLSAFGFTDGCIYIDATWSNRNDTMTALHPEIETSTGANEFSGADCWLVAGGTAGFGLKIQGTTRAGDSVASSGDWWWGWGGTSDIRFYTSRLSGVGASGGCFHHDAQLFGNNVFAQGVSLHGCDLRLSGAGRYMVSLDRSNRITFDTCYGETTGTTSVFNITSRTQQSVDGIMRVNDKLNCDIHIDDVDTGYSGSTVPWHVTRCMTMKRHDGRDWTRNMEPSASSGFPLRFISRGSNGIFRFAIDSGSGDPVDYLNIQDTAVRPMVSDGLSLGTGAFPYLNVRASNVYNSSGIITSSDATLKQDVGSITPEVLAAWGSVEPREYRYRNSVAEKGGAARTHFGYIAQEIVAAFEDQGMNAFEYGIVGIDRETEKLFVRYDQCSVLDAALLKAKLG